LLKHAEAERRLDFLLQRECMTKKQGKNGEGRGTRTEFPLGAMGIRKAFPGGREEEERKRIQPFP